MSAALDHRLVREYLRELDNALVGLPAAQARELLFQTCGVLRQLAIPVDKRGRVMQLAERAPDRLMDAERMRIVHERGEEQFQRLGRLAGGHHVT